VERFPRTPEANHEDDDRLFQDAERLLVNMTPIPPHGIERASQFTKSNGFEDKLLLYGYERFQLSYARSAKLINSNVIA
jgi:hypothetical protein